MHSYAANYDALSCSVNHFLFSAKETLLTALAETFN